jgi:hypothetical protein
MAKEALAGPNRTILYFGATAKAVRLLIWTPVWQFFRKVWHVGGEDNESTMTTRFGNGSVVAFIGTDDYRHVETMLGGKLWMVVIDEAQSQPHSVLDPLINRILPPALSDNLEHGGGILILAGTIPEVEAGLFYEIWKNTNKYSSWTRHNWNRFDNPHIESVTALAKELVNSGRTIDDPLIRRDWFGEFVFAKELTAFRYDRAKAGYDGKALPELNLFAAGVDPGTRDRTAIVVWGWSTTDHNVYQVYEWVTPRNSGITLSVIASELKRINLRFPLHRIYFDMGGSNMAIDTFTRDYGLPIMLAAKKTDRLMQVERFADLLALGRAKVIIGSALEEDLQKSQWDKDKLGKGQHDWSSVWHPDVADAARYAIEAYFDAYRMPEPKLDDASAEDKLWKELLQPPTDKPYESELDRMGFGR